MVQQCAEATEQAAPGKDHQIVIVGILYTITMDEQWYVDVLPVFSKDMGCPFSFSSPDLATPSQKLASLPFPKQKSLKNTSG